jgi:hypothetical protein
MKDEKYLELTALGDERSEEAAHFGEHAPHEPNRQRRRLELMGQRPDLR